MCTGGGVGAEDDLDRWIGEHANECVDPGPTGLFHPCERNRCVVTDPEESVSVVKVVLIDEIDLRAEVRPVLVNQLDKFVFILACMLDSVFFYDRLSSN